MFKNSVRIFVEKMYEIGFLEGSGVPFLYIGRMVPEVNSTMHVTEACIDSAP
jgi:hypothetical protein